MGMGGGAGSSPDDSALVIGLLVAGVVLCLVAAVIVFVVWRARKQKQRQEREQANSGIMDESELEAVAFASAANTPRADAPIYAIATPLPPPTAATMGRGNGIVYDRMDDETIVAAGLVPSSTTTTQTVELQR
jgi:hypothetical protein